MFFLFFVFLVLMTSTMKALGYRNGFGQILKVSTCSLSFNFAYVPLGSTTTECWSWEYGQIWVLSPKGWHGKLIQIKYGS